MTYNANMKLTDCSILVVDDDELVIHSISNFLKPRCKKVYVAHNGIEALDIYYGHEIDVMFVDIEMPKMNGLEFIREVRNTNKQVKIFVCTGHSTKEYLLEAVPLHLEGFVIKPITTRKLLECLYQAKTKNGNIEYQISSKTGLRYQFNTKRLILKNREIHLTHSEILLLELLLNNKNSIVTYAQIDEVVYENRGMGMGSLRSLIKRLRKKLGDSVRIEASAGVGYVFKCLD